LTLDPAKGQGGTPESAILDAFKSARDALSPALRDRQTEIKRALLSE
jgi:hypothetical protein